MKDKKIFLFIMIFSLSFTTGCWNSREINTLAISVCFGIDKSDDGYKVTQQIVNPKVIASKKPTNESPIVICTESGTDLFELMRKLTTEISRKIYFSHMRIVVISEEVAREGIQDILDYFARDHEYRTDFYFVIAKGTTANNVLSVLTYLNPIPGVEMYDSLKASEAAWAPTKSVRIVELVNSILADGKSPVIPGIEVTPGANNSNSTYALKTTNESKKLKYTQLGVFKKDKLVGWLEDDKSKGVNYIIGNVKSTIEYDYYKENIKITTEIKKEKSKIKASLQDGKPVINVNIEVEQNVGAVEGEFNVSKIENRAIINKLSEEKIKLICDDAVNEAQKELKTDIFGFGEAVHIKYPKLWAEIKDDWDDIFTTTPVNITVDVKTKQLGQITKPLVMKEKK